MKILNKILNYLIIITLVFIIVNSQLSKSKSESKLPKFNLTLSLQDVNKYYETADSIALDDINLYNVYDDGNLIGTVMNTSPYSDDIYGYNSVTPLNIFLDENERVMKVELCKNKESRGYISNVIESGFLDSWNGLTAEEAANFHVDAVSGSTYSSTAIAQSMQTRMQLFSQQKGKLFSWDWKLFFRQVCILIVTILALICFFMPKRKKLKNSESRGLGDLVTLRRISLLLSIAVLGFWNNSLLSLALFCNWLTNGVSLAIQIPLLIIAALSIILPLVTKKSFYCQYLCPFGAAQEFVGAIGQKSICKDTSNVSNICKDTSNVSTTTSNVSNICKDTSNVSTTTSNVSTTSKLKANIHKVFSVLRKVILLSLLIIFALGLGLDLSVVEPFPIFNYQSIGFGVAIFAAVIIIASIFIRRPWCNYLCPTGTLLESFRILFKSEKRKSENQRVV